MKRDVAVRGTIGVILIFFGLGLAGKALGLFDFNLFFNGWWTLFIIIPSILGLSDRGRRTSSILGLGIGLILLLSAQGVFRWDMFFWIMAAFIFVVVGFSLIFKKDQGEDGYRRGYDGEEDYRGNDYSENNPGGNGYREDNYTEDGYRENSGGRSNRSYTENESFGQSGYGTGNPHEGAYDGRQTGYQDGNSSQKENNGQEGRYYGGRNTNHGGNNRFTGLLSGRSIQYVDEVFTGAIVESILGSVQLDLRNAIFPGNALIEATCILGGVDIFVPSNVKVVNNCSAILAGVDNKVAAPLNSSGEVHTLIINGTCILGGIEIKY